MTTERSTPDSTSTGAASPPGVASSRRILVVCPSVPYPPNWGFGIRVFNLVRELGRTSEVSVACYADDGDDVEKVAGLAEHCAAVHTVPPPLATVRAKRSGQLRSVASRHSFQSKSLYSTEMVALLRRLVATHRYDLIQLESSQLMPLAAVLSTPIVLDEHNIEYELLRRMVDVEHSPLRKGYNWLEYQKFRREETAGWARAAACVMTSDRERDILRTVMPSKLVHVAPNGVDIDYFRPDPTPVEPDSMVYTGLMSYRPNVDAVKFFVRDVLPRIVAARPHAMFNIVGLGARENVGTLAGPNVDVIGEVPDVRPHIRSAAVVTVPLRMGSGTRLKVLEGLAMGKAMVSTRVGCEGISVNDGEHLLMADDPDRFADAVIGLMADAEAAARLGAAGRALAEDHYSWTSISRSLAEFHTEVLRTSAGR